MNASKIKLLILHKKKLLILPEKKWLLLNKKKLLIHTEDVKSISHSEVINEEVVRELAENVEKEVFSSDMLSQQEISEIENLISEKNLEKS